MAASLAQVWILAQFEGVALFPLIVLINDGFLFKVRASDMQDGLGAFLPEEYEEPRAPHGDEAFAALQRRLACMPEQVCLWGL